jgi:hypothetical protein
MIAAIYARKSTKQNGVADEATSVTRRIEHARACVGNLILVAVLLLLTTLTFPTSARAQAAPGYEHYRQGTSKTADYFSALYKEFGERVRRTEILKKCGYKKEADGIETQTRTLVKRRLDGLIETDAQSKQLPSMGAIIVAHEATHSMWVGYALGFRESFTLTSDLLPARAYEGVCKDSLEKAREWSGEVAK